MSAFICGSDHIKALAIFAAHSSRPHGMNVDPRYFKHEGGDERMYGRPEEEIATYYANILYCENIRSVQGRYPNDTFEDLPGPCDKAEQLEVSSLEAFAQYSDARLTLTPLDILKMCDCLEYQSCESADYRETLAWRLLGMIRRAAWRALPGYDDAPWEYTKPELQRRRAA